MLETFAEVCTGFCCVWLSLFSLVCLYVVNGVLVRVGFGSDERHAKCSGIGDWWMRVPRGWVAVKV